MHKVSFHALTILLVAASFALTGACLGGEVEQSRCRLHFPASANSPRGSADLMFRLPEHVAFVQGSELTLAFKASAGSAGMMPELEVEINGRKVPGTNLLQSAPGNAALRLGQEVAEENLRAGWNRVALKWSHSRQTGAWEIDRDNSFFLLSYQRLPLMPELLRFPHSFAEEKLLSTSSGSNGPAVTILLPYSIRDVHLRACAVLGARLGQLEHLSELDCEVGPADKLAKDLKGNALLVGQREELGELPLLGSFRAQLDSLLAGQGLLEEIILGDYPHQRRLILATGADDAGLEKAILSLGSDWALASLPPSPAVIYQEPASHAKDQADGIATRFSVAQARVTDLSDLDKLLVPDESLGRLAFLVPAAPAPQEVRLLFELAMLAGKALPSARAVSPEACSYGAEMPLNSGRLQNRSVLLLGAVHQWKHAVPAGTRLGIEMDAANPGIVRMQGRKRPVAQFEPGLLLAQILPSPWWPGEALVLAGGWNDCAGAALKQLLINPESKQKLLGNIGAADSQGRAIGHDTRRGTLESFADKIQKQLPRGLTIEETTRHLQQQETRARQSARYNRLLLFCTCALLLTLAGARVALLWERERSRKQLQQGEKPLGGAA
jgi:hypothetical protein